MNSFLERGNKLFGKAALLTVALGGFLALFGASTASARPVVYVYARPQAVFVGPGYYYGPRTVYVGPVYGPYRHYRAYRYRDYRNRCWRYR